MLLSKEREKIEKAITKAITEKIIELRSRALRAIEFAERLKTAAENALRDIDFIKIRDIEYSFDENTVCKRLMDEEVSKETRLIWDDCAAIDEIVIQGNIKIVVDISYDADFIMIRNMIYIRVKKLSWVEVYIIE